MLICSEMRPCTDISLCKIMVSNVKSSLFGCWHTLSQAFLSEFFPAVSCMQCQNTTCCGVLGFNQSVGIVFAGDLEPALYGRPWDANEDRDLVGRVACLVEIIEDFYPWEDFGVNVVINRIHG